MCRYVKAMAVIPNVKFIHVISADMGRTRKQTDKMLALENARKKKEVKAGKG